MRVEPAHVDQIRRGMEGRMVLIDADVGGVAADLRALDPGLKVRFAERGECFVVFHDRHPGCPHNGVEDSYLVTSVKAQRTASGTFTGLDQRVVDRLRALDPSKGRYDFAADVERMNRDARDRERKARLESLDVLNERAAHAVRKDLGARYRGRAFVPRDIPS